MASPPKIDATDPQALTKEIFDDDRWVKDEFANALSTEVLAFAEKFAAAFEAFQKLDALAAENEQTAFVTGFVHGVLDDLITSMKLLVAGKLMASGNLMRQAIEGVALALLCASNELVLLPGERGRKGTSVKYWEHVKRDDPKVAAHRALGHLEANAAMLGLNVDALADLKKARKYFHQFSHPGMMGIASRTGLGEPGPIYLGGSFDKSKLPAYKIEIEHRLGLCGVLPKVMDVLVMRVSQL